MEWGRYEAEKGKAEEKCKHPAEKEIYTAWKRRKDETQKQMESRVGWKNGIIGSKDWFWRAASFFSLMEANVHMLSGVYEDTYRPWTMHSSSIVWPLRAWYVLSPSVGLIMCGLRFRSTELAGQREAEMHLDKEKDSCIWMGNFQIAVLLTLQPLQFCWHALAVRNGVRRVSRTSPPQ